MMSWLGLFRSVVLDVILRCWCLLSWWVLLVPNDVWGCWHSVDYGKILQCVCVCVCVRACDRVCACDLVPTEEDKRSVATTNLTFAWPFKCAVCAAHSSCEIPNEWLSAVLMNLTACWDGSCFVYNKRVLFHMRWHEKFLFQMFDFRTAILCITYGQNRDPSSQNWYNFIFGLIQKNGCFKICAIMGVFSHPLLLRRG